MTSLIREHDTAILRINSEMKSITRRAMNDGCHEAGHAVAARHLGLPLRNAFYKLERKRGNQSAGGVEWLPCGIFDVYAAVARYVSALRHAGRKDSMFLRFAALRDRAQLGELLNDYLCADQIDAYEVKLEDDVAGFLYQPDVWKIVTDFAEKLVRCGSLASKDCMLITEDVPLASLAEIRQMMLDPTFHNYIGRPIGRAKRLMLEKLLVEAVDKLRPAFEDSPDLEHHVDALIDTGYSKHEARAWIRPLFDFWRRPDSVNRIG
jgi:hypothetical protein